jgi:hypothetical protein
MPAPQLLPSRRDQIVVFGHPAGETACASTRSAAGAPEAKPEQGRKPSC